MDICGCSNENQLTENDWLFLGDRLQGDLTGWSSFWKGYWLIQAHRQICAKFLICPGEKFQPIAQLIEDTSISRLDMMTELAVNKKLRILVSDAVGEVNKTQDIVTTYDFTAGFPGSQDALTGLTWFFQFCQARCFNNLRFKALVKSDLWDRHNGILLGIKGNVVLIR